MTAAGTCERDVTSNSSASHHVRLCSRFGLRPEAHAQMGCMLSREYLLHARTGIREFYFVLTSGVGSRDGGRNPRC